MPLRHSRAITDEWVANITEFGKEYRDATKPLRDAVSEQRRGLLTDLETHLQSDSSHFLDFAEFLTSDGFKTRREQVRPLLVAIADDEYVPRKDREESRLTQIKKALAENLGNNPTKEILTRYITSDQEAPFALVRKNKNDVIPRRKGDITFTIDENPETIRDDIVRVTFEGGKDTMQVLLFLYEVGKAMRKEKGIEDYHMAEQMITDDDLVKPLLIVPINLWPRLFRDDYRKFLNRELNAVYSSIRAGLDPYRKRAERSSGVVFDQSVFSRKRRNERNQGRSSSIRENTDESQETSEGQTKYNIGLIRQSQRGADLLDTMVVLNDEERKKYLSDQAKKLAGGPDDRMRADISAIIDDLQKDPYGYATQKIKELVIVIDEKPRTLRSVNPRRRPELILTHPDTGSMRVLYIVYGNNGDKTVIIEGIYTHNEYEKRLDVH